MDRQQLTEALIQIRLDSIALGEEAAERDVRALMNKYDMIFSGEKYNIINSFELRHALINHFKIQITQDELIMMLPDVCKALRMSVDIMINSTDAGTIAPPIAGYFITLY